VFKLFGNKSIENPFVVDIHSHLIPGIDDGVETFEEAGEILRFMINLGYTKVVTTPHIMGDFYQNNPGIINEGLNELREYLKTEKIDIEVDAAAEYHLDEHFISLIENNEELLTIGNNYILFETPFMNEPVYLKETIFTLASKGYKPILAHPERYNYLLDNWSFIEELIDRGVFLQINLMSLSGHYSKPVQKMAEKLLKKQMVSFVGSDIHRPAHLDSFHRSFHNKFLTRASNDILNNSLS